jgi:hypothetical protein
MIEIKSYLSDPNDKRSCLCCGRILKQRERLRCRNAEEARAGIESLENLGYTKEEMLGLFRGHLDWQAPGLADYVRRSLS